MLVGAFGVGWKRRAKACLIAVKAVLVLSVHCSGSVTFLDVDNSVLKGCVSVAQFLMK